MLFPCFGLDYYPGFLLLFLQIFGYFQSFWYIFGIQLFDCDVTAEACFSLYFPWLGFAKISNLKIMARAKFRDFFWTFLHISFLFPSFSFLRWQLPVYSSFLCCPPVTEPFHILPSLCSSDWMICYVISNMLLSPGQWFFILIL